jgi:hypothetical protein
MNYRLIARMNKSTLVVMTPIRVQLWQMGRVVASPDRDCAICNKEIGDEPCYVPIAGVELPNTGERIHEDCMIKLDLLVMQVNPKVDPEEINNGA